MIKQGFFFHHDYLGFRGECGIGKRKKKEQKHNFYNNFETFLVEV